MARVSGVVVGQMVAVSPLVAVSELKFYGACFDRKKDGRAISVRLSCER